MVLPCSSAAKPSYNDTMTRLGSVQLRRQAEMLKLPQPQFSPHKKPMDMFHIAEYASIT